MKNINPDTQKKIDAILNQNAEPEHFDAFDMQGITTGERIRLIAEEFNARAKHGTPSLIERAPGSGVYLASSIYALRRILESGIREIEAPNAIWRTNDIIQNTPNTFKQYDDNILIPNSKVFAHLYQDMQTGITQARRLHDTFNAVRHSDLTNAAYIDSVLFSAIMKSLGTELGFRETFQTVSGEIKVGQRYMHADGNFITGLGTLNGMGTYGLVSRIQPEDASQILKKTAKQLMDEGHNIKISQTGSLSVFKGITAGSDAYYHASGTGLYRTIIGEMHNHSTKQPEALAL